jgi:uncharacterized membrane protein YdjX (TVP38/TMEM64 family)
MNKLGAIVLFWIGLMLLWRYAPGHERWSLDSMIVLEKTVSQWRWAPIVIPIAYAVLALLAFPQALLLWATVFTFPPQLAFVYMLVGSLVGGFTVYGVGRRFTKKTEPSETKGKWASVRKQLQAHAKKTLVLLHWFPILPFHALNLLAGISHVKPGDFFWGTVVGMVPGLVILCLFRQQLFHTLQHPSGWNLGILGVGVSAVVLGMWYVYRRNRLQ